MCIDARQIFFSHGHYTKRIDRGQPKNVLHLSKRDVRMVDHAKGKKQEVAYSIPIISLLTSDPPWNAPNVLG